MIIALVVGDFWFVFPRPHAYVFLCNFTIFSVVLAKAKKKTLMSHMSMEKVKVENARD